MGSRKALLVFLIGMLVQMSPRSPQQVISLLDRTSVDTAVVLRFRLQVVF